MKTSNVLASVLFSTMALAAPVDKRAYATKTEVTVEYYTVYTTVTGAQPAAAATSDPALFYEDKPKYTAPQPTTVVTSSSPSTTAVPSAVKPTYQPPPVVPTTSETKAEPTTTSVYTPPPVKTTEAPPAPPASTEAPPPPPSSTLVPEPKPEPSQASKGDGEVHTGGSYTMNYYGGGTGACGEKINDTDPAVALAVDVFGDATVDYMTGLTNNPWCGKKIEITNNGMTTTAYIKDRCSGCTKGGLDATKAVWDATTGGLGGSSGDRIYSMSWRVVE